ncbi:MAG: RDD family protein [marine benthic group bacterium]|nr:RDD family protein [Candidatus Benthicola marisminoris]
MTQASGLLRIKAFAFDYLVILAYLAVLAGVGTWLTLGPAGDRWSLLMSDPIRADLVAFLTLVLPVILSFALSEASDVGATVGKRRIGLRVVGPGGTRLRLPRSLVRSGLKFLPWQMAHTAMFHIPGFPTSPGEPPAWSPVILSMAWLLVALYLLGLTPFFGRRTLYDRIAGSTVVPEDPGPQNPASA